MISRDPSLIWTVQTALESLHGRGLHVVGGVDEASAAFEQEGIGLVFVHLEDRVGAHDVARLLGLSALLARPVPVVVMGERYATAEALAMFRMGVADYLSRADHLDRLGDVIDVLTRDVRKAPLQLTASEFRPGVRPWPRPVPAAH